MTDYTTTQAVRSALDIDTTDETTLALAVTSASRLIDSMTGRNFGVTTSAARYFDPLDGYCVPIDDAATVTAVATDDGATGLYATSWATTDWQAQPVGGIAPSGLTGWPYRAVVAVSGRTFSKGFNNRPVVKVTGTWGWAAVPSDVAMACLMLASEMFKAAREAPFGSAGLADFGPVTIRGNRRVIDLLAPYKTTASSDGRFLVA
jgi:hypothetical protein